MSENVKNLKRQLFQICRKECGALYFHICRKNQEKMQQVLANFGFKSLEKPKYIVGNGSFVRMPLNFPHTIDNVHNWIALGAKCLGH